MSERTETRRRRGTEDGIGGRSQSEPRIIAVDWSGAKANSGSARKIALAEARDGVLLSVADRLTREDVVNRLIEYARERDVIAGLDFGFSMPAWYLQRRGFTSARLLALALPWRLRRRSVAGVRASLLGSEGAKET